MASATAADWSGLPGHLLEDIAIRTLTASSLTGSVEDFMAFRAVCTEWRAAATKDVFMANYSGRWRLPHLMLAEKEGSCEREFYNISTGKICGKLFLPEASGKRCMDAGFGWLITLARSGEVELLNPISRSQIELPNFRTFRGRGYPVCSNLPYRYIERAVLSANPSETSDFVMMVHTFLDLAFWKNGDKNWTRIEPKYKDSIHDVAYCKSDKKFYAISTVGHIWRWDPNGCDPTVVEWVIGVCPFFTGYFSCNVQGYLMEFPSGVDGEMLIVTRNGRFPDVDNGYVYGTTEFRVFKLNVLDRRSDFFRVEKIPNGTIFVGHNVSICVQSDRFPGLVKPNCIYFSDDSLVEYRYFVRKEEGCECCSPRLEEDEKQMDGEEGKGAGESESDGKEGEKQSDAGEGGVEDEQGEDQEGHENHEHGEEEEEEVPEAYEWVWKTGNFDAAKGGGKNMGICNIEDGSIERFDESVETPSLVCPPFWISPPSLFA